MNTQKSPTPNDGLHWAAQAVAHACLWYYVTKKMTPTQMAALHIAFFGLSAGLRSDAMTRTVPNAAFS